MLVALQAPNGEARFNAIVERIKSSWTRGATLSANSSTHNDEHDDNGADDNARAQSRSATNGDDDDDDDDEQAGERNDETNGAEAPKYLRSVEAAAAATTAKLTLQSLMACASDVAACG